MLIWSLYENGIQECFREIIRSTKHLGPQDLINKALGMTVTEVGRTLERIRDGAILIGVVSHNVGNGDAVLTVLSD